MHFLVNLLLQVGLVNQIRLCRLLVIESFKAFLVLTTFILDVGDVANEARFEIELVEKVSVKTVNFATFRSLELSHLLLQLFDKVLVFCCNFSHFGSKLVLRRATLLDVLFFAWHLAFHKKSAEAVRVPKIASGWCSACWALCLTELGWLRGQRFRHVDLLA